MYVTAMGAASGKFLVTLGIVDMLARCVKTVGFDRPVVPRAPDNDIELIRFRGLTSAECSAGPKPTVISEAWGLPRPARGAVAAGASCDALGRRTR